MRAFLALSFCTLACVSASGPASAAYSKIKSPIVHQGEFELETYGYVTDDDANAKDGKNRFKSAVGYGFTDYWFMEVESEWGNNPGKRFGHRAIEIENRFQFVPQGTYAIDIGGYAAWESSTQTNSADKLKFGPIFRTQIDDFVFTLNPFISAEIGKHSTKDPEFTYALQAKYLAHPMFSPGVEIYGEPGQIGNFNRLSSQDHAMGPVITGVILGAPLGLPGKLKYEAGVLFGLTSGTAARIYKGGLEYEFTF